MKYLRLFSTKSEYESEEENLATPNISLCLDDNKVYYKDGELIYHWNSDDDLVNGYWVDRIKGAKWQAYNVSKVNGMYYVKDRDNYFYIDLNDANNGIVLPYRWKVEVDCILESVVKPPSEPNPQFFVVDFGSLTGARHAFGIDVVKSQHDYFELSVNYKPLGNDGNSKYGGTLIKVNIGERVLLTLGVEKYDENSDIMYIMANNANKTYGKAPHEHTMYDKNWSSNSGYIGTGLSASYSSGSAFIKSIKIYAYE